MPGQSNENVQRYPSLTTPYGPGRVTVWHKQAAVVESVCIDPSLMIRFGLPPISMTTAVRIEVCQVADSELRWRCYSFAFRPAPVVEIPTWTAPRCVVSKP